MNTTIALVILGDIDGWDHMRGWGWGMAITGWLFMTLIIGVIAWSIWLASRQTSAGGTSAADRLDERYANGEVDRDAYLQMKADLR